MTINWKSHAEKAERELTHTKQQLDNILSAASRLSGENDRLKKHVEALLSALAVHRKGKSILEQLNDAIDRIPGVNQRD